MRYRPGPDSLRAGFSIVTTTATRMKVTRLTDEPITVAERVFARIGERSLDEIVDFFMKNYRKPLRQIMMNEAVEAFIADRTKQIRRPDTLRNLCGRLGMFVKIHGGKNHYKGLVKEADATEFWKLTPKTVKSEIVKFPLGKAA